MKNKLLIIIAVLLAFVAGIEYTYVLKKKVKNGSEPSMVYNSCSNCMSGTMIVENGGITQTVKKVYDSVVMVKNFQDGTLIGSGSGFVYKTDDEYGYIMTNQHVVDKATEIKILFTSELEVVGEYLGRIFIDSKNRPIYLVNEYNGIREENILKEDFKH